jgi:hypothetical protein
MDDLARFENVEDMEDLKIVGGRDVKPSLKVDLLLELRIVMI